MRKPWWVRAVGLLGWVCAVLWVGVIHQKSTPQSALGQLVLFEVLPFVVLGLWILWGVMSFVLYVLGRAGKQNAAILRDVLAANHPPATSASALGPRGSGRLDQISLNSPPSQPAPARQTGSMFGLTLGQQLRTGHPAREAKSGNLPRHEMPPGPPGVPFRPPGATGGPSIYTYEAPGLPQCPECGVRPVIFYCTRHSQALCLECVVRHDRVGECTYVPGWRGEKSEPH